MWITTGTRPAPAILATASAWLIPCTAGTFTVPCPFETESVTVEPRATCAASGGSWSTTTPCGCAELTVSVFVCSPCCASNCSALSACTPTTFGTVTCPGPVDTTAIICDPSSRDAPASGAWPTTSPGVPLPVLRTNSTLKPASVAVRSASACCRPTSDGTLELLFRSISQRTRNTTAAATQIPATTHSHHG